MSAMKTLVRLEYSRYNLSRLGKHHKLFVGLILIIGTVFIGVYLPGSRSSERTPFIYAALLLWSAVTALSAVSMMTFMNGGSRDWMLSFPHSRLKLLYAKMISLLVHSLQLTPAVLLAAVILYIHSARSGWYPSLSMPELFYLCAAYTLFILVFLPLAVITGLAISLFIQPGKLARLMFIPYTLLWMSPFFANVIYGTGYSGMQAAAPGSPGFMLYVSLAVAAAGWPLGHLLMKLVAAKGMGAAGQEAGSEVPSSPSRRSGTLQISRSSGLNKRTSAFMLLYRLNAGRKRQIEKHPVIIILKLAVPVIVAAAAYLGSNEDSAVPIFSKFLFALPVMFGSLWMISRSGIERRQQSWLLSLPQSRLALLLSGVAVVWITAMRILAVLLFSAAAGSFAGLITGRTTGQELSHGLSWLVFSFLLFTLAFTITLCLLQLEYYLMRSPVLGILMVPLAVLGSTHGTLIGKFLLPAEVNRGMQPDWSILGWIILMAFLIALVCLPAGAKYYHLSLSQPVRKKE